jgi:hypothetical protein
MTKDEQAIRQWFERWMKSTILERQGDGWVVIRDANTMVAVNEG